MTSFIEYLKESSDCLYIYDRNFSVYGLENKERYLIVVKDGWVLPGEWNGLDNSIYQIIELKNWFELVLSGALLPWECACLNKKYVIKEHVKLMMTTKPLELRKNLDQEKAKLDASNTTDLMEYWEFIKNIRFAIQIIQNHKIVNFKEAAADFSILNNIESEQTPKEYSESVFNQLKTLTDGMLKKELLEKIKTKYNDTNVYF